MLPSIVLLLIVGLLLIVIEAVLPGWVAGTVGALAVLVSAALCYSQYGSQVGTIYLVASVVLTVGVAFAAFQFVTKHLAIKPSRPGVSPAEPRPGAQGVAMAPLRPTGTIEVAGRRYQARCESSEQRIEIGGAVTVVGRDSTFLVVRANSAEGPVRKHAEA